MTEQSADRDPPNRVERLVKTIGVVVGGIVAINAGVTALLSESVARASSFRTAVSSEEAYWRGLYQDYLATFDKDIAADEARREAHYQTIASLAEHPVPDFAEFNFFVSASARADARDRLAQMQWDLKTTLLDPKNGPAKTITANQQQIFEQEQFAVEARPADRDARQSAIESAPAPVAGKVSASRLSYATRVLAVGKSNGWDIDIFWCQGPDEGVHFAQAVNVATLLGNKSSAGERVGGEILGRVRLRSLPKDVQSKPEYAPRGPIIVADNAAEKALAKGITDALAAARTPVTFQHVPGASGTAWYIGAFVCPTPAQAPALAPPVT